MDSGSDSDEDFLTNMSQKLRRLKQKCMLRERLACATTYPSHDLIDLTEIPSQFTNTNRNIGEKNTVDVISLLDCEDVPAGDTRGKKRRETSTDVRGRAKRGRGNSRGRGRCKGTEDSLNEYQSGIEKQNTNSVVDEPCIDQQGLGSGEGSATTQRGRGRRGRGVPPGRGRGRGKSQGTIGGVMEEQCGSDNQGMGSNEGSPIEQRGRGKGVRGRKGGRGNSDLTEDQSIDKVNSYSTEVSPIQRGRSKRGRGRSRVRKSPDSCINGTGFDIFRDILDAHSNITQNQQPNRSRTRRGRGRQAASSLYTNIPTYNIGNTDFYPDNSAEQPLFAAKEKPKPVADECEEDNEELSVKVYWQSDKVHRFNFRKYQKLSQIFDFFKQHTGMTEDKLLFMYNDRILKPNDTPYDIGYKISKFIDGGLVNSVEVPSDNKQTGDPDLEIIGTDWNSKSDTNLDVVKLKFQSQETRQPHIITVGKDERLNIAMMKYAEHLNTPLKNLRFEFDGESIYGNVTPRDVELENGDTIDVVVLNK